MIRHLTFTIFILFSLAGNTQNIADKWQFDNIRKVNDTTNLRVISNIDYMLINEDSTFEYEISSIALKASGEWELKENILSFHYDTPSDTSRFYSVELKKGTLVLNENDINYSFTSSKYLKPIQTGFDIMTILRGLLGIAVLIGIAFAFSRNR